MKSSLHLHSYNGSSASHLDMEIMKFLLNHNINSFAINLAGHDEKQGFVNTNANLPEMLRKAKNDLDIYFDSANRKETYITAVSTGAYIILDLINDYPDIKKKISGLILIKPLIDLQETINRVKPYYNSELKKHNSANNFGNFIKINEYLTSKNENIHGVINNPFNLGEIKTLLITAVNDEIVGNYDFISQRINGSNLSSYEIKDGVHSKIIDGELDQIEEQFSIFLNKRRN